MKKINMMLLLLLFSVVSFAATVAHPVIIEIEDENGEIPEGVFIQAMLNDTLNVLTDNDEDVYFHPDGYVHIQCGQFEEWNQGDILYVELSAFNGAYAEAEYVLNYDNFQYYPLSAGGMILTGGVDELTLSSDFASGWNLWSFNVTVPDLSVDSVFSGLTYLTKVKSITESYDPALDPQFNTLDALVYGYGYWVQVSADESMDLTGEAISESTEIPLASGWNLVAYLPQESEDVEYALESLITGGQLVKVKSITQSYDPALDPQFNTLAIMTPGYGYWVNVNAEVTFSYPAPPARSIEQEEPVAYIWTPVIYTNSTCAYGMIDESFGQVGAFVNGECRGVTEINEGHVSLVINGTDAESVNFKLYQNGQVTDLNTQITTNPGADIFFEFNEAPEVTTLKSAYPNPFNPETTISFELAQSSNVNVSVYNVKGQKVTELVDETLDSGDHQLVWNAEGKASGIYFIRLHTENTTQNQKVILMK